MVCFLLSTGPCAVRDRRFGNYAPLPTTFGRRRDIMKIRLFLLLIGLHLAIAAPVYAVQGRAYVQRERQIVKLTKEMVQEQREADAFKDLLKQLDSVDLSESSRDFWRLAHDVKDAMVEEVRQGQERLRKEGAGVQEAGLSGSASSDADTNENPLAKRVKRMEMIVLETEGLRNPVAMSDPTSIARYRYLVGEFHSLLQAEVDEFQAEIDALKAIQRAEQN